jgi:putative ABC transport system permease protein
MFKNYFLIACSVYMRRKLFTAINLLCIVLTLMVLLMLTAALQTLFYPTGVEGKSARFLQVERITQTRKESTQSNGIGYKVIEQYLRKMKSVEQVAALTGTTAVSVFQDERVVEVIMRRTDAAYWQILDFTVLAGRVMNADDVEKGRFLVVLSASTVKKIFGVVDSIAMTVGKKVNVMGQVFEVIGVVDDELHLSAYGGLWAPITTLPNSSYRNNFIGEFSALLLAKSTVDIARIKDEMAQVAKQVNADEPERWESTHIWADDKLDFVARSLMNNQTVVDSGASKLIALIIGFMLLFMVLPALNLINLNTGRIMERASEIGVRKAFGASNLQLVAQFLMENILLCIFGGVMGILLAKGALVWLGYVGIVPSLKVDLSWQVLSYGFLLSVVFGLLSGVIPAWRMARLDPVLALKGGA